MGGWKGSDDPISNIKTPASNVDTPASKSMTPTSNSSGNWALSKAVKRLLLVLGDDELTREQLMRSLKLKDRKNFSEYSLGPALKIGLVEMTQPDSPRSPTQRYRLTACGQKAKKSCV